MKAQCQVCDEKRDTRILRITKHPNSKTGYRTECLFCNGLTEGMVEQYIKTENAFFDATNKMWASMGV